MTPVSRMDHAHSLQSSALRANLRETAVDSVSIAPEHVRLLEPVAGLAGVSRTLERLLVELSHPFRNWRLILPELRRFLLSRSCLNQYIDHEEGHNFFATFVDLFFQAINESRTESERYEALEVLTAYLHAVAVLMSDGRLARFSSVFDAVIARFSEFDEGTLLLLSQTHQPVRRTVTILVRHARTDHGVDGDDYPLPLDPVIIRTLAVRALRATYGYWLNQPDPDSFEREGCRCFEKISHRSLEEYLRSLAVWEGEAAVSGALGDPFLHQHLRKLIDFPSFLDLVRGYKQAASELARSGRAHSEISRQDAQNDALSRISHNLRFSVHILEIDGLGLIHEETLRDLNRNLLRLVRLKQRPRELEDFLLRMFALLKSNIKRFPDTALHCIETLGTEIFKRNNSRLIEVFLGQTVRFGFQHSDVIGIGSDWQPLCNPAHLRNIRVWL
ncbi:MAG: hypothetical protein HQL50_00855, partial [Magnetococcales bacterium]|nr:hypothetical protein [Magnetococcales bacterium]